VVFPLDGPHMTDDLAVICESKSFARHHLTIILVRKTSLSIPTRLFHQK